MSDDTNQAAQADTATQAPVAPETAPGNADAASVALASSGTTDAAQESTQNGATTDTASENKKDESLVQKIEDKVEMGYEEFKAWAMKKIADLEAELDAFRTRPGNEA